MKYFSPSSSGPSTRPASTLLLIAALATAVFIAYGALTPKPKAEETQP